MHFCKVFIIKVLLTGYPLTSDGQVSTFICFKLSYIYLSNSLWYRHGVVSILTK